MDQNPTMQVYQQALSKLIATDIQDTRRDPTQVNIRMRVGETYAVRANDDPNYFFTVTIQPNPYSGGFRKLISQFPTYGDPPPGMQEISQSQVFKQFRELNGDGASTNFSAFPFRGASMPPQDASESGQVSQHHLNLQQRGRRS